jgi:integrase/recombinase XerD
MKWNYWICLYTRTHCVARGLRPQTIAAYRATLGQFQAYVEVRLEKRPPDAITAPHVLEYLEHLRRERNNGDSAVNRQMTILKNFYRAMVAMGHLLPSANPLAHFPKIKAGARKLPVTLSAEEVQRLLAAPPMDTVLGLRDRAILALLYGTGIRASECAQVTEEAIDLDERTIRVVGKGGHERTIPLNEQVVEALDIYRHHRGDVSPTAAFFRSRSRRGMSRGAVYERVRTWSRIARIRKRVSPHRLRHTFATHLVKAGVSLVAIRDLLGHRLITSTQIYLHVTAEDLRAAADRHPIRKLAESIGHLLPSVKLPFQPPPGRRRSG